jgi:hypothetical protein
VQLKFIASVTLCAIVGALTACTMLPASRGAAPDYVALERVAPAGDDRYPNWPLPPLELEALLRTRGVEVVEVSGAGGGTTGALEVTLRFPSHGATIKFKWKQMLHPNFWIDWVPTLPGRLDGINNSPRKEIAAAKLQELFLELEDYVVPVSAVYCVTAEEVADSTPVRAHLDGTNCRLGLLSTWLRNVTLPYPLLDAERFQRDPVYAYYLANFNLLTYLMAHHDGREGNFLVSKNDSRRQVFAIDNGVSFGGPWYNWFVPNWCDLRVPALRRASIDKLRELTEEDLQQVLGVVAQLERDADGILRGVDPGANLDDDDGVRYENGVLQLGLTYDEIEDVWERLEDLIEDVDEGDVAVF